MARFSWGCCSSSWLAWCSRHWRQRRSLQVSCRFPDPTSPGLEPDPSFSLSAYESHYAHLRPTMDPDSVSATFSLDPYVPGALEWNPEFSQVTFVPEGAGYEPGQHVFSYLMQAVTSGDSAVLPTHVDPMYEPEVWSCSEGTRQTRLNCADLCRSEPWWRHLPLREPLVRRHLGPFVQKN